MGIEPRYEKYLRYATWAGGGLLLIIFFLWLRKKIKKVSSQVQYLLNPYEEALQTITKLRKTIPKEEQIKFYYIHLTDAIRHYLERKYGFGTEELTTIELFREVEQLKISDGLKKKIIEFFQSCDLVKFANLKPSKDEIHLNLDQAEGIVEKCNSESIDPHQHPAADPSHAI